MAKLSSNQASLATEKIAVSFTAENLEQFRTQQEGCKIERDIGRLERNSQQTFISSLTLGRAYRHISKNAIVTS